MPPNFEDVPHTDVNFVISFFLRECLLGIFWNYVVDLALGYLHTDYFSISFVGDAETCLTLFFLFLFPTAAAYSQ